MVPTSSIALTHIVYPTAASLQKILQQSKFLVMGQLFHFDVSGDDMLLSMLDGDVAMIRKADEAVLPIF